MKELVVISGKGGTGKTSIVASLAALKEKVCIADCDVDAADLHLVVSPKDKQVENFIAGYLAEINPDLCTGCNVCADVCRFDAVKSAGEHPQLMTEIFTIDPLACEGCGVCMHMCASEAISMEQRVSGKWYVADTRYGPMVHAKLGVAAENSGKLVSLVRAKAREQCEKEGCQLIIVDGPPGIGCPVIASVTGAALVLVVVEPTMSGAHDLARVLQLSDHFQIPSVVCINKWDINGEMSSRIESDMQRRGIKVVGKVRYDPAVTKAQIAGVSVVEYSENGAATDIKGLWQQLKLQLNH